ncbi:hypothetical protein JHK87_018200 [Glycine soja]|nr:hypothetical protein JHK87_018200 [Glycine soja]
MINSGSNLVEGTVQSTEFHGKENAGMVNGKKSLISFMSCIVSDPQNAIETWKSPGVHVCHWSVVGQLSLSGNFLQGHIPSEFGSLHNLYYLDLGSNDFEGDIPPSVFCNGT